jgi:hypothetical protein
MYMGLVTQAFALRVVWRLNDTSMWRALRENV